MSGDVVDFADNRADGDFQVLEATCANPRCDEQFRRIVRPGRPKDFHSEDCRRSAEREQRRLAGLLSHYERQADQMRARIGAYLRTSGEDTGDAGPSASEVAQAHEAIAEVRGMARFLPQHQGEFAPELLKLFEAVEPLVRTPAT